jgi:hypothetical protein
MNFIIDCWAYGTVYALTFNANVFASSIVPAHPSAVQVFEQFGIPGLWDSADLEWFSSRWNLKDENVFDEILKRELLLNSNEFSDNRAILIRHLLFKGLEQADSSHSYSEHISALISLNEYEILIELFCKYPEQVNEFFGFFNGDNRYTYGIDCVCEFYKVLKVSPNMELFLEKCENIDYNAMCHLYSIAILDDEALPSSFLNFLFSKFDLFKILIDFTIKRAKILNIGNEELYFKITKIWDIYVAQNNLQLGTSFNEKLFKLIVSSEDVTLKDLEIDDFDFYSNDQKISLFSMALKLKRGRLLGEIILFFSSDELKNVINHVLTVNKDEDDLFCYLIFCVCRKLPISVRKFILASEYYSNFVDRNFKVHAITIDESGSAYFKFGAHHGTVQAYRIPSSLNCKIIAPITVEKLKDWFDNIKFTSPPSFSQFLNEISKLPAFQKLIKSEQAVNINTDNLIQVATCEVLNRQVLSLGLRLYSADIEFYKLMNQENLLDMSVIASKTLIIKLIKLAIYDQASWESLNRFCGGKLPEILIEYSNEFSESDNFIIRYAFVYRMKGPKRLLIAEIKNRSKNNLI